MKITVLTFVIIIIGFIVIIGILNEKLFHIQSDIALILFSLIISLAMLALSRLFSLPVLPYIRID